MKMRQDIQILRGVAILMVVLFHLQTPFFSNGFLGVDVFFVISGFLMAKSYNKGTTLDFYKRRIDRLLPAYSLTVIGTSVAAYFILIPADFSQLYEQAVASVFFVSNIHFWSQTSYFEKAAFNPLLNLWAVSVEAQFYLIVPFLYPLLRKSKALTLIVFGSTLAGCLAVQIISPKTSFFLMPFRIWEFLAGAWVAWNGHEGKKNARRLILYQITSLMLLLSALFLIPVQPDGRSILFGHPSLVALLVVVLTGAIIDYGLPRRFEVSPVGRILAQLGDYSYSLFLVHFPLIVLWNYQEFGGTILSSSDSKVLAGILLTVAIACYGSYNLVEQRFAKGYSATLPRLTLLFGMLIVAFGSYSLNKTRFDPRQQNIFSAWTDRGVYRCGKIFRILNPTKEFCMLSEGDSKRSLLLVGDSHADSIKTSFAKIAVGNKIAPYFVVPNDPLIGTQLDAFKIVEEAQKLKIDYIAIHFGNIYEHKVNRDQVSLLVKLSQAKDIGVAVIAPVPYYDEHIPRAMYQSKEAEYSFSFDRVHHEQKISAFNELAKQLRDDGAMVFDPAEILCPSNGKCIFADSALKPYYFDFGHLTLTGASQLEPLLDAAIKSLVAN
jgi:peptidoglycan/LPS O-acetylase OafA/YrhL